MAGVAFPKSTSDVSLPCFKPVCATPLLLKALLSFYGPSQMQPCSLPSYYQPCVECSLPVSSSGALSCPSRLLLPNSHSSSGFISPSLPREVGLGPREESELLQPALSTQHRICQQSCLLLCVSYSREAQAHSWPQPDAKHRPHLESTAKGFLSNWISLKQGLKP